MKKRMVNHIPTVSTYHIKYLGKMFVIFSGLKILISVNLSISTWPIKERIHTHTHTHTHTKTLITGSTMSGMVSNKDTTL